MSKSKSCKNVKYCSVWSNWAISVNGCSQKNMNCKLKLHSKGNTDKFGGTLLCLNFP